MLLYTTEHTKSWERSPRQILRDQSAAGAAELFACRSSYLTKVSFYILLKGGQGRRYIERDSGKGRRGTLFRGELTEHLLSTLPGPSEVPLLEIVVHVRHPFDHE